MTTEKSRRHDFLYFKFIFLTKKDWSLSVNSQTVDYTITVFKETMNS